MIKSRVSKIIPVPISDKMVSEAKEKAEEMGKLNNSIRSGEGNIVGFLGEEIVKSFFNITSRNTYNYDILYNDKKYEVKTKETTVVPKDTYDCSVAAYNTKQQCDYYIFVRVLDTLSKGWILGFMEKDEYMKNSIFLKKGDIDLSNNYTVKADCYNMKIYNLKDIKQLINEQKKKEEISNKKDSSKEDTKT